MTLDEAQNRLKFLKKKNTAVREAVLTVMHTAKRPITVKEIQTQLSTHSLTPHKTTIYREISFLLEHEFIRLASTSGESKSYEWNNRNHHHHVICERCERIEDVLCDEVESVIAKLSTSAMAGFTINTHSLEFFGTCQTCRNI